MGSLFSTTLLILSLASITRASQDTKISPRFLDLLIRNYSFQSYGNQYTTGKFHSVELPANFLSIKVHTAKFRCGSLRRYGAQINEFNLPPGINIQPCVERTMLVIQNLGFNWSSIFYTNYNLSGYKLISPVLGLLAYNAGTEVSFTDPFEIGIQEGKKPIIVNFKNITTVPQSFNMSKVFCAKFDRNGKMALLKQALKHVCYIEKHGHVGLVVAEAMIPQPPAGPQDGKSTRLSGWKVAVGSTIGAALAAFLLGLLLVAMLAKVKKKSKMEELERRAYEEEALQVSMVGHVRAPAANGTRTGPTVQM